MNNRTPIKSHLAFLDAIEGRLIMKTTSANPVVHGGDKRANNA